MPEKRTHLATKVTLIVTALLVGILLALAAIVSLVARESTIDLTTRDAKALVQARAAEVGRMAEKVFLQMDFIAEDEEMRRAPAEVDAYIRGYMGRLPPEIAYVFWASGDGSFVTSGGAAGNIADRNTSSGSWSRAPSGWCPTPSSRRPTASPCSSWPAPSPTPRGGSAA